MTSRPSSRLSPILIPMTALLVSATLSAPALAQSAEHAPQVAAQTAAQSATQLGAGVWFRPVYAGSDESLLALIPLIRYYGSPWFVRTTQGMLEGGAQMALTKGITLGGQIAYEGGRDSEASDFLKRHKLASIPVSASLGVHAEWDTNLGPAPVNVLLRYRQEAKSERGAQTDLRATIGIYGGDNLKLGLFAQTTWANAKSNQAYYGITTAQAASTGLAAYSSAAGMTNSAAGLLWSYDLSAQWLLQGSVESRQFSTQLRNSPLTQVRNNSYASAGLAYRF